jgi:hypothetical protein
MLALAAALVSLAAVDAVAERPIRMVYNPMTGRSEPDPRYSRPPRTPSTQTQSQAATARAKPRQVAQAPAKKGGSILDAADSPTNTRGPRPIVTVNQPIKTPQPDVTSAGYCEACGPPSPPPFMHDQPAYDDGYYGGNCDTCCDPTCCEPVCCDTVCEPSGSGSWSCFGGFEAVFVQPRFSDNLAFTVMESDDNSFESFEDVEFDYDLEFTPRLWLGVESCDGLGVRATWWQFDHAAAQASANPPANGFGSITPPTFRNVNLSTSIPSDTYSASTDLNVYTLDLEITKHASFCNWEFGFGGGLRYARAEQGYFSELRDDTQTLLGRIDYRQSIEGVGPTISLSAFRPLTCTLGTFCAARGSVLFGDGKSSLSAGDDLDLSTPFLTTSSTSRQDVLTIGEVQLGVRWSAKKRSGRSFQPFASLALEGQVWNNAGNASSEEGTLGFFGFNAGTGLNW